MRLGVLFSGGKDSILALYKAMEKEDVVCLITVISDNKESYMFHTPNIHITEYQADSIGLPLVTIRTAGVKEEELKELRRVIEMAKEKFEIDGIVAGTVESVYQATRIQRICDSLGLWCFNPLWQKNQLDILREVVELGFDVVITGVFAEPFDSSWLGRKINSKTIDELKKLSEIYKISPAGEGGEFETTVLDGPIFKKRLEVKGFSINFSKGSGIMEIKKLELKEK
ncbi:MAG: TIGR00289 family protein [Candidatus Aenigmarchaeota archaeon]|nr:TIGR00289 family protein [Candidatus Aenigmarchaeota archaeon]